MISRNWGYMRPIRAFQRRPHQSISNGSTIVKQIKPRLSRKPTCSTYGLSRRATPGGHKCGTRYVKNYEHGQFYEKCGDEMRVRYSKRTRESAVSAATIGQTGTCIAEFSTGNATMETTIRQPAGLDHCVSKNQTNILTTLARQLGWGHAQAQGGYAATFRGHTRTSNK